MFMVFLYVNVKETEHLKSSYKAQNTIPKAPTYIAFPRNI